MAKVITMSLKKKVKKEAKMTKLHVLILNLEEIRNNPACTSNPMEDQYTEPPQPLSVKSKVQLKPNVAIQYKHSQNSSRKNATIIN